MPRRQTQREFECASYADEKVRAVHGAVMRERDKAWGRARRLERQLTHLHNQIYAVVHKGVSIRFLEGRAEQIFMEMEAAKESGESLDIFLKEQWDRYFMECYRRLRLIEGGR